MLGSGFRVRGFRCGIQDFRILDGGLGFRIEGLGFRAIRVSRVLRFD